MLDGLTVDAFAPLVGDGFALDDEGAGRLVLELLEARAIEAGAPAGGAARVPFSLLFRGPGEPVLPQRIYSLRHDALGALEIFIVPVARQPDGMRYEAIFA